MDAAVETYRQVSRRSERDARILANVGLVRHVLGRILPNLPQRVDRENLEAAGMLGLVEAAGQYDPNRGVPFATFAVVRIRGAILDELRRNCPLPQSMLQKWTRIQEAYQRLSLDVSLETLAAEAALTVAEVEECLEAIRLTQPDSWFEELTDQVPDRTEPEMRERELTRDEQVQLLAQLIEQLPTQMRMVVTLYYRDGLRLKEIGEVLHLSESRISRILTQAELLMRERVRRHS
jgi:RNA polymerase sigma factor for flagellar operon FliA